MSMHEIEDAIEATIRLIDRAGLAPKLTRDIIWNLYDYQGCFDTGLTTGRLLDILRRWRYLLPPDDIELGTDEWRAREGKTGIDAEPPDPLQPQLVGRYVMTAAECLSERQVISYWYALLPSFAESKGVDLGSMTADPEIAAMLAIVERTRSYEIRSDWGALKPVRPEDLPELSAPMQAFLPHWYALEWSLPPQRDRSEVVSAAASGLRQALERGTPPADALATAIEAFGEFSDWSSFLLLFHHGFGYSMFELGGAFTDRINRVVDFSGPRPRVNVAAANAELSLQTSRPA